MPLSEAVRLVSDGSHVALTGFSISRNSVAAAAEVVRQGRRRLTVSQTIAGFETDLLVGAGCVERLLFSGGSLDRFGRLSRISAAIEEGSLAAESYSGLSLAYRYLAGSLGLPYVPAKSLLKSDILREFEGMPDAPVVADRDPFTGDEIVLLRCLQPDIAIATVHYADPVGNYIIEGARWDTVEALNAADTAILLTEHLVETSDLRRRAELVHTAFNVAAVVHMPWAAFPTAMFGVHDYDALHLEEYVRMARDRDGFDRYLEMFVQGCPDHQRFIERALSWRPAAVLEQFLPAVS
jgi:glutaconate CoA-transferase subunit A